jgi:TonB family protein
MIERILVPKGARLPAAVSDAPPRRTTSDLDERTLVPSNLPHIELDPHTSIPAYLPLGVLGTRTVVPRDMPSTPLDAVSKTPEYVPLTILDSRVAVPKDAHSAKLEPKQLVAIQDLPDVLDPDVLTTGEVNLMAQPVEEKTSAWNTFARIGSIAFHFAVLLLILFGPRMTPQPNQAEIDRNNITDLYMPNDVHNLLKAPPAPPRPKTPQVRVDPRLLRQLAPPRAAQPAPTPEPEHVAPTPTKPVPSAPMPQPRTQPPQDSPILQPTQPPPDAPKSSLVLPHFSPGKALQENLHEALKEGGTPGAQFEGPVGPAGGGLGRGGGGGGGGGQGDMGGAVQMLTPTEGVDFSTYLSRVLASVKRNWYAVMPESALLGDRGRVVLQFRIMRNGVVPEAEPSMVGSSGKDPLDRAAVSSIRASTPFEPLPSAFSGPYIELRFIFLYNLPLNSQ